MRRLPLAGVFLVGAVALAAPATPRPGELRSRQATQLFYETLYEYHYRKRPYRPIPALAERLPVASRDFKTYTIRLRRGVRFHDDPCFASTQGKGREVRASDAVYMFERLASLKPSSPDYDTFEHLIEGIDEFHAGRASSISGVRALDAFTLEVRLTRPHPRLVYDLTDSRTSLVPRECVEHYGEKFARHPVGTGAFVAADVDLRSKIVATRNPGYREQPLPLVDRVVLEVVPEAQPQWLKFRSGQLDLVAVPPEQLIGALAGGKLPPELAGAGIRLDRELRKETRVFIFNMREAPWGTRKELRHAFALALDVPELIEKLYSGQARQLHSLLTPDMYGFEPRFRSRWSTRDLAEARRLLAAAGYPGGKGLPPLVIPTTGDGERRHFVELAARQLARVGITLQPETVTWPELVQRFDRLNFGVAAIALVTDTPDADDALSRALTGSTAANPAGYSNAEADRLGREIGALPDGAARLSRIRRFEKLLDDELPYVPLLSRYELQLSQPWVQNHVFVDDAFLGTFAKYQKIAGGR